MLGNELNELITDREKVHRALNPSFFSLLTFFSCEPSGLASSCSQLIEAAQDEGMGTGDEDEESANPQIATETARRCVQDTSPRKEIRGTCHRRKALGRRMARSGSCLGVLEYNCDRLVSCFRHVNKL